MITPIEIKDKTPIAFQRYLRKIGACHDARQWCKGRSLKNAWRYCRYYGWLRYLLIHEERSQWEKVNDAWRKAVRHKNGNYKRGIRWKDADKLKTKMYRQSVKVI